MDHDYKKISTNWNKFLAEGAFNLNEDEEPNGAKKKAKPKVPLLPVKTKEQLLAMTIDYVKDMIKSGKPNPIGSWGKLGSLIFKEAEKAAAIALSAAAGGAIISIKLEKKVLEDHIAAAAAKVIAGSTVGQTAAPSR